MKYMALPTESGGRWRQVGDAKMRDIEGAGRRQEADVRRSVTQVFYADDSMQKSHTSTMRPTVPIVCELANLTCSLAMRGNRASRAWRFCWTPDESSRRRRLVAVQATRREATALASVASFRQHDSILFKCSVVEAGRLLSPVGAKLPAAPAACCVPRGYCSREKYVVVRIDNLSLQVCRVGCICAGAQSMWSNGKSRSQFRPPSSPRPAPRTAPGIRNIPWPQVCVSLHRACARRRRLHTTSSQPLCTLCASTEGTQVPWTGTISVFSQGGTP